MKTNLFRGLAAALFACALCLLLMKWLDESATRNDTKPCRSAEKVERRQRPAAHIGQEKQTADENEPSMEFEPLQAPPAVVFDSPRTAAQIRAYLNEVLVILSKGDPEQSRISLDRLAIMLRGQPHDSAESIKAIVEFLATGKDGATGQSFIIGEGGTLEEAPTLRVFLIDYLGFLGFESDRNTVLDSARQVLSVHESADEWAISMRNIALLDTDSRAYLVERVTSMLGHQPWMDQPTPGMLEAFDLIVHAGAMEQVPTLLGLLDHSNPAFWRASTVTLDRLAMTDPHAMASYLNAFPSVLSDKPMIRADLFAKIDLAVPEQRTEAESYLARTDVQAAERTKFLQGLIAGGLFVSHNLVTVPPDLLEGDDVNRRLDVFLAAVNDWMTDSRFSAHSDQLEKVAGNVRAIRQSIGD